ncbi:MAG: hypothetical protein ILP10_04755 [Lachnospiraceae bacterium]|nr:hypothetical protein [Lachnospiraceae bacterium]
MNIIAVSIIFLIIMELVLLPLYVRYKKRKYKPWLKRAIKGTMTLISFAFCLAAILKLHNEQGGWFGLKTAAGFETNILVAAALFVCAVADVVLTINLAAGGVLFLLGHVCYISYFLTLARPQYVCVGLIIVPAFFAYKYFAKYTADIGMIKYGMYMYGITILGTFSLGIVLPYTLGGYGWLPAIASTLLVISDFMLATNSVTKAKVMDDLIYLGFYFSGQYVMALSVFYPVFLNL